MTTTVRPVSGARDLRAFIEFPYRHYAGHPQWVPPLRYDQRRLLDRRRHPFYRQATAEFFLAERDGRTVGRVAAIHNRAHNEFCHDATGFFGFFETEDNPATAQALLGAAAAWCAGRGLTALQGPVSPSTNYECALLIAGFDRPPAFMMPYNYPYYAGLIEAAGFVKAKDLLAYWLSDDHPFPEKLASVTGRLMKRYGLTTRDIRMDRLDEEIDRIFKVYNDAWSSNWGFVPMSREEIAAMAADFKWVVDPRVVYIAERGGEPVGFLLALPELNLILKDLDGRLLPLGWLRLLRARRRLNVLRVLAMGSLKEYQSMGFAAALYHDIVTRGTGAGYHHAEIGWVLEDNVMMNRAAEMLGSECYKRFRIYHKDLPASAGAGA